MGHRAAVAVRAAGRGRAGHGLPSASRRMTVDPRHAEWPWLPDCARLDWALHRCERAADTGVDASSMARLGDTDPARLVLVLAAGVAVVESAWPIAMIRAAHRGDDERAFIAVSEAIAEGKAEAVLV